MDPDDIQHEQEESPFAVALAATEHELNQGQQYYLLLVGKYWYIHYHGPALVH
jgi:hypothetical protein